MTWKDLLQIKISDHFGITAAVGPILILFVFGITCYLIWRAYKGHVLCGWSVVEADVSLGGIGHIKIRPSCEDVRIAHKAWVELVTRKAALPFDEEHDVIAEVYDSWYVLFREMRALAKDVPIARLRNSKDTQELIHLLVDALNQGLRPHLTKWQARFKHWYKDAIGKVHDDAQSPQEIQKLYPHYEELLGDLKLVNKQLVEYANVIKRIAHGDSDENIVR